jgi:hypothetical protein
LAENDEAGPGWRGIRVIETMEDRTYKFPGVHQVPEFSDELSSRQESKEESENMTMCLKVADAMLLILSMGKKEKKWR